MIFENEKSNAQSWELEISCKNKKYLDAVVKLLLKHGMINFQVTNIDCIGTEPKWDGRYLVMIWCAWFHNLNDITRGLARIENKFENNSVPF